MLDADATRLLAHETIEEVHGARERRVCDALLVAYFEQPCDELAAMPGRDARAEVVARR